MKFPSAIVQSRFDSPLGTMAVAATSVGLAGAWFIGQQHQPPMLDEWPYDDQHPLLRSARVQLLNYLEGRNTAFDLPLDLCCGTPFQQAVWQQLRTIRRSHTTSYGALAQAIDRPKAVRAVGAAVGRNPLSVIVPCHRVLGATGSLTGYAGGLERKRALLALEGAL
ncbi:MAG TPA: methylated-DNA--[protein]-cysteine S-methyltransferase [Burkholderiaceae bacterium]